MKYELTQEFWFDAAHTLLRAIEAEPSRRIHGHTYHAAVSLAGPKDPVTGLVVDLGHLRAACERVRERLDHHFLDEVTGLGKPTLENLCGFVWQQLERDFPQLTRVRVERRAIGDACELTR